MFSATHQGLTSRFDVVWLGVSAGIAKECTIHVRIGTSKRKREQVNVHCQALNIHWLRGINNFVIQNNKRIADAKYPVINHCSCI